MMTGGSRSHAGLLSSHEHHRDSAGTNQQDGDPGDKHERRSTASSVIWLGSISENQAWPFIDHFLPSTSSLAAMKLARAARQFFALAQICVPKTFARCLSTPHRSTPPANGGDLRLALPGLAFAMDQSSIVFHRINRQRPVLTPTCLEPVAASMRCASAGSAPNQRRSRK